MRDLASLPKAHLHVHLESTVRWDTLREIGDAHGLDVPPRPPAALDGFAGFFALNSLIRHCLRAPEDFHRVAREFCADEAAQGTRYAEVSFTAAAHGERLGDAEMPLLAVLDGLAAGSAEHGITVRLLLDHSRRRSLERARATVELARRHRPHVVAVGLAGDEDHPAAPFTGVFAEARDAGLRIVHHAGEAKGPGSIREAIAGGTERLGHGIRVLDDPALVDEVRERGLALEVCPASNVALGFAPSHREHPLPALIAAGLPVTLNTDIPAVLGTTLTDEYARLRDVHGLDDASIAEVARTGVRASFAPGALKSVLLSEIDVWAG